MLSPLLENFLFYFKAVIFLIDVDQRETLGIDSSSLVVLILMLCVSSRMAMGCVCRKNTCHQGILLSYAQPIWSKTNEFASLFRIGATKRSIASENGKSYYHSSWTSSIQRVSMAYIWSCSLRAGCMAFLMTPDDTLYLDHQTVFSAPSIFHLIHAPELVMGDALYEEPRVKAMSLLLLPLACCHQ